MISHHNTTRHIRKYHTYQTIACQIVCSLSACIRLILCDSLYADTEITVK